jgi:hypothetical protein
MEVTIKFRTFHVPSYRVDELREDRRPFARVMYAGRLSYESGDDVALREKFAWELLKMPWEEGYDKRQRKYMLEFTGRIFRLGDPRISEDLREAYKLQTMTLNKDMWAAPCSTPHPKAATMAVAADATPD